MPLAFSDGDFQQISRFGHNELLRLHQFLVARFRVESRMEVVVSVRLPPEAIERIKMLAFTFKTTRSQIIRRAIDELVRRNPL